jgi:hypothetical protein
VGGGGQPSHLVPSELMLNCDPSQENLDKLSNLAFVFVWACLAFEKIFKMLQKLCFYVFSVQSEQRNLACSILIEALLDTTCRNIITRPYNIVLQSYLILKLFHVTPHRGHTGSVGRLEFGSIHMEVHTCTGTES